MQIMKNVKLTVNLRRFLKSLTIFLLMFLFVLAGTAFTSFTEGEIKKAAAKDSTTSDKSGFISLIPTPSFDPSRPYITKLNPKAVSFVQRYMVNEGENLEKMKVWGKPYLDLYDRILPQYGIPKELKYLSIIESSLIADITSPAGAVGPWQIMPQQARDLGLKVDGRKDERKNFAKSTHAAAKMLKGLHEQFGDWLLVIAAYNCGDGRVRQAIRKSGSHNYWELQEYLPKETRGHIKRFIGTHYIFEGNGGLTTMTAQEILEIKDDANPGKNCDEKYMTVEVNGKYIASIVAKNIGMPIEQFKKLNPEFDRLVTASKPYSLKLPDDKIMAFANNKKAILSECLEAYLSE